MKSYDDFIASLTPADMADVVDNANTYLRQFQQNTDHSAPSFAGNQIAAISYHISLGLLEKYHQWLNK